MAGYGKIRALGSAVATCTLLAGGLVYLTFARENIASASPAPELLSALPAGAPTLAYVDLAALRASSFYRDRPDKEPIAIPNQDYADFVRSTGFDFEKDLDRAVIASWPAAPGKDSLKSVAIAEGRFNRAKIRDFATQKGKVDQQQGREVFLFPAGSPVWNSVTFLDDHRIAIVAGPTIAPLFAANSNDPAADPARERAARLDGAALFVVTRAPPIPDSAFAGSPQSAGSAQLLSMARSVQWITLAARPEGDNLRISLEGECDTSTDALQLKSALELLRMLGRAGLENPKTTRTMNPATLGLLQTILTTADVTQSAERVRILVELTPDVWLLGGPRKAQR